MFFFVRLQNLQVNTFYDIMGQAELQEVQK